MEVRRASIPLARALARQAVVCLVGPRQVGKTTLARSLETERASIYIDLESPSDRAKLAEPELFFRQHKGKLIILDEIHRTPELFQILRGVVDQNRARGRRNGQFLVLGSAAIDLLRQSGESLAGRIEYVHLSPFDVLEVAPDAASRSQLWVRGGFPDSFHAADDADSFALRNNFIRTYLERDVPQFGPRVPEETLRRLWTMLAHSQGGLLNASKLAGSLSVSSPTVASYIDLLSDLLLVRRLLPFVANTKKRLVKAPKIYVRDSGLVHALLGLEDHEAIVGHPVAGSSWEGFAIENLINASPDRSTASFYRTSAGAEIDLLLQLPGKHGLWAIEVKLSASARVDRGFHNACDDVHPTRKFVVYAGDDRYPLADDIEAISLNELTAMLANL